MTSRERTGETTERYTLSTGHAVEVPLELEATITGAVFSAPLEGVRDLLPDGLRPLRVTPRRGAVTFLSVDYSRIGDDAMEPYNELSILIPSVEDGTTTIPLLSGWLRSTSGYVWYMPVTTEPARALGREIWGYPKVVADVSIDHRPSQTRTEVVVDGERFLTMDVKRPPSLSARLPGYTFSELDGRVVREKTVTDGEIGVWPLSDGVSMELGNHRLAEELSDLDLGNTAVQRLVADCDFEIHPPTSSAN